MEVLIIQILLLLPTLSATNLFVIQMFRRFIT